MLEHLVPYRWRKPPAVEAPSQQSLFRVLRTDEELQEAVERAARFEQMVARSMGSRAKRYEAMMPSTGPVQTADRRASRPPVASAGASAGGMTIPAGRHSRSVAQ